MFQRADGGQMAGSFDLSVPRRSRVCGNPVSQGGLMEVGRRIPGGGLVTDPKQATVGRE